MSAFRHIPALDGLRGIAILLVMANHFMPYYPQPNSILGWMAKLPEGGWSGVNLFFVLSGFLITSILLRDRNNPDYFKRFYIRRTLRIFPLYYAAIALALVLPFVGFSYEGADVVRSNQVWIWGYGVNILNALQAKWMFEHTFLTFNHFWSLAVEEHFLPHLAGRRSLHSFASLRPRLYRHDPDRDNTAHCCRLLRASRSVHSSLRANSAAYG